MSTVRIWIDIENPPQVQYLLPFERAFEAAGAGVTVTARDYGITYDLLRDRGVAFEPFGASYGKERWRKALGLAGRTQALATRFARHPRPAALVCAGRASTLAARLLGIPSFVLGDYEYVDQSVFRLTRSFLAFPDVIDPAVLERQGIRRDRLVPYRGIKEDLTFAGLDIDAVEPHVFPQLAGRELRRVLFRPPAEESHYYSSESGRRTLLALELLAGRQDTVVILTPRYARQVELLERFTWENEPLVLEQPVDFVSLLKAVDAVVSAGGTMLREAAYLGVPAFSIFGGQIGAVDRHLESRGRMHILGDDLGALAEPLRRQGVLDSNPHLLDELAVAILERAGVPPAAANPVRSAVVGGSRR